MTDQRRFYIVAGEASGDLHGANLVRALRDRTPDLQVCGWGGDHMAAAGVSITKHYRELAFMGFVEVVKHLRTILRNFRRIQAEIIDYQPDALILIDYPGFNLRLAKWAKKQGIRVVYYISPQVWAWHASRAFEMARTIDLLIVILPFETEFFKKYGIAAKYVGHPLLDVIDAKTSACEREAFILVLPGSRKQEVEALLPIMLSNVDYFSGYRFIVAGVRSVPQQVYTRALQSIGLQDRVEVIYDRTYELMQKATAGIVKSGTSTLEAALHNLPQVVCYKGNRLSYLIAKQLVQVKYISLVNLVLNETLVTELIQHECNSANIRFELERLLEPSHRGNLQNGYERLFRLLGTRGASARAAEAILADAQNIQPNI